MPSSSIRPSRLPVLALVATGLALPGCGLKNILPGPPVVVGDARAAYDTFEPSGAAYTAPAPDRPLVLPLQVWGLRYSLDVVLETTHPDWIMHEYARIDTVVDGQPKSLWIAKDADTSFVQTITSDVPDIKSWLPEIPVPRHPGALSVTDLSAGDTEDLRFSYTNPHNQAVEVHYRGAIPIKPANPRNGNTMGHSRPSLMALLDIHLYNPGGEAEVTIGGKNQHIRKLYGLYPMKFLLAQTQGGIAITDFVEDAAPATASSEFQVVRPGPGVDWPTEGIERWTIAADGWVEREGLTKLRYHFVNGELDRAEVWQPGLDFPVLRAVFQPALPDMRRHFDGDVKSRFVVDVAGQEGHGMGEIDAHWDGDVGVLDLDPTAPHWFADRPMQSRITVGADGRERVQTARVGDLSEK